MMGYERTIIQGNVGADAELKYTGSGVAVCNFNVAVSRRYVVDGEQREETNWYRVVAWRGLAETCGQYVTKGMAVLVDGRVKATAYLAQDGTARATLELTADNVQFIGSRQTEQADEPF